MAGDVLGYARVSTGDQDVAGQELRLMQAGAIKVFTDVISGKSMERPGLAELIAYDRATIGGVVDRLESKGLVERTIRASDRRAREVRLSDEGQQLHRAVLPLVRTVQQDIVAPLSPGEQDAFIAAMRKLVGTSSDDDGAGAPEA